GESAMGAGVRVSLCMAMPLVRCCPRPPVLAHRAGTFTSRVAQVLHSPTLADHSCWSERFIGCSRTRARSDLTSPRENGAPHLRVRGAVLLPVMVDRLEPSR